MSVLWTPAQIMERLQSIEADLETRMPEFEDAAQRVFKLRREYDLELAKAFAAAAGSPNERKQEAIAVAGQSSVFAVLSENEGIYEARKAAVDLLKSRSIIGTALLKAHGRA